jgi:hypothetical protein
MTGYDRPFLASVAFYAIRRRPTDAQLRLCNTRYGRRNCGPSSKRIKQLHSALIALAPRPATLERTAQTVITLEELARLMASYEAAATLPTLDDDLIDEVAAGRHDDITVYGLEALQKRRTAEAAQKRAATEERPA